MNIYASQVLTAGAFGGFAGAVVNGMAGWLSKDTTDKIQKRIILGIVAGAAIAALGAAIALSNSTGAALGALVGLVYVLSNNLDRLDNVNSNRPLFDFVKLTVETVTVTSFIGYIFSKY